jgi:hypothetical protein
MQTYGYDFHQTMIAKIEAARRPLRVRELADFAALYDVGLHELIYPPSGSLEEVTKELTEAEMLREVHRREAQSAAARAEQARAVLADAQGQLYDAEKQLAMLEERVHFLRLEKAKLSPRPDPFAVRTPTELLEALRQFRGRPLCEGVLTLRRYPGQFVRFVPPKLGIPCRRHPQTLGFPSL